VIQTLEVTAPAKINLTLRVVGRRADGLHLLDGITAFSTFGDLIRISRHDGDDRLHLSGPFASRIDGDNIVSTAIDRYRSATGLGTGLVVDIEKNIPVAAGLGGGSSNAGAVLRVLQSIAKEPLSSAALEAMALSLGADVPSCLALKSVRMRGIGERLSPIGPLPRCPIILVNPGVPLSAGNIFGGFAGPFSAPPPEFLAGGSEKALITYLGPTAQNDLVEVAVRKAPVVSRVLNTLSAIPGAQSVGMSGSGATCFALFSNGENSRVEAGVRHLTDRGWWAVATELLA
jgi:4-diphosphocytidyl-2-C-methyl-D-erythritol kinase